MPSAAVPGAIDFRAVMERATERYVPRPLLEREVRRSLLEPANPCQLIVGELGSGKTALASHFIQREGYLHHFLRVGHSESTLWRDPYAFLTSLGFQLKAAFGGALFPEMMAMSVSGTIHDVGTTGRVVGIDVERYVTVPWRREEVSLEVDFEAQRVEGKVAGIRIGELVEEYRHIPLLTFREMAWFEPLRRLRELASGQRVVFWIDGLDEDAPLPGSDPSGGQRIVDILPLGSELADLGNALLVVTSRRGPHLDRFQQDGAPVLEVDAPEYREDTERAIAIFMEQGLASPDVSRELTALQWPPEELRRELSERSEQNFLYARQFFESLRAGQGALLREGGLPSGLESIYERILGGLVRAQGPRYAELFHPVLEVLAVAYDALTGQQLARLSGLSRNRISEVLSLLKPFLDTDLQEQEARYTFHHKSLRDFLTHEKTREAVWHVDPRQAHTHVGRNCDDGGLERLDAYGFQFGTSHLARGGEPEQRLLMELIDSPWRELCRKHFGSNRAFLRDLEAAAGCARKLPFEESCREISRYALTGAVVGSAEGQIPRHALEVMVRLHQTERALEYLPGRARGVDIYLWYVPVLRGLASLGAQGQKLVEQLLQEGIERATREPSSTLVNVSRLLKACEATQAPFMAGILERVARILLRAPAGPLTVEAYVEGARLWSATDLDMANLWFRAALAHIYYLPRRTPSVSWVLAPLLRYWSQADPFAAEEAIRERPVPLEAAPLSGMLALDTALEKAGVSNRLLQHLHQVIRWLLAKTPTVDELRVNSSLMRNRLQLAIRATRYVNELGFRDTASSLMEYSLETVKRVRATYRPENTNALDLLLEAAEVDLQLDPARAQRTLEHVWEVLAMHREQPEDSYGIQDLDNDFMVGLPTLVRLQLETDGDLLEPYVESLTDLELKSRVALEVARQLAASAPARARDYLEAALRFSEWPNVSFWCLGKLHLALASEGGPDDRGRKAAFLEQRGIDPDSLVRWRLRVLGQLQERESSEAWEWLVETLALWDREDLVFVEELPAALSTWPAPLVRRLPEVLQSVRGPVHRRYLQAALARCLHSVDPERSARWLDLAATTPEGSVDAPQSEPVQLAFVAGQVWQVDAPRAADLWKRAVALLDKRWPPGSEPHGGKLGKMVEHLRMGSPRVALPELLRLGASEESSGFWKNRLIVPGVNICDYGLAGMYAGKQYPIAVTLVEQALSEEGLDESLLKSLPPAVRSLFWSRFAPAAGGYSLSRKLAGCQKAAEQARLVEPHGLCCLLLADAAGAYLQLGAKQRARELALGLEREVLASERPVASILDVATMAGYAHALGQVLRVEIACGDTEGALGTLWKARALGVDGFLLVMASLPAALHAHHSIDFDSWVAAVDQAFGVYAGRGR